MLVKEIKRFSLLVLAVFVFSFSLSPKAKAYTWQDVHCIGYKLFTEIRYIPHEGYGTTSISHINEALYQWNEAMDDWLLSRDPVTRTDYTDYPKQDGINKIYHQTAFAPVYVGENTLYFGVDTIIESDININMYYAWANSAQPGKYDVWSVILHEAGHTIGLDDHEADSSSVMYYKVYTNSTKRYLSSLDKFAVDYLY